MLFYRHRPLRSSAGGSCAGVPRADRAAASTCPRTGGYVLAPSHRSMMDIPFAAWLSRRAAALHGQGVAVPASRCSGAFFRSARRLRGRSATAPTARRCATRSRCCRPARCCSCTRRARASTGPKIQPLQPGAAYLALRAGVPIVPVGIAGSEEILRSAPHEDPALRARSRWSSASRSSPRRATAASCRAQQVDALDRASCTTRCRWLFDEAERAARRGAESRRMRRDASGSLEARRGRVDASSVRSSANGPPAARAAVTSPPSTSAAAASSAGISSRSSRGGGKYSSSSVTRTSSTPSRRREPRRSPRRRAPRARSRRR